MATLYEKNGVTISDDFIEIDGEKIPRNLLWSAQVYSLNEEYRSFAWGIGGLIIGFIMITSFNWTIIGIIFLLIGAFLAFVNGKLILEGKIETRISLSFALNEDIRDLTHKHIKFNNKKDAEELKKLLKP